MLSARHLIERAEHKRLYLENRLSTIEVRLMEIEREKATLMAERVRESAGLRNLRDYSPSRGTDFLCPDCWAKGVETVLKSTGETAEEYIYRCPACLFEIEVSGEFQTGVAREQVRPFRQALQ